MPIILTDADPAPPPLTWFDRECMELLKQQVAKVAAVQRHYITLYGPDGRPVPLTSENLRVGSTINVRLPRRYGVA